MSPPHAYLLLALAALMAPACGPVDADHPLDPDTPRDAQRPSRLEGQLIAPGGDATHDFAAMTARLYAADADPDTPTHQSAVDDAGRFRFDAVRPGTYRFDARDPTLAAAPFAINVSAGAALDLGPIALHPLWGVVAGTVLDPNGAPVDGAALFAGDVAAPVDPSGHFRATVTPGRVDIIATAPGHAPAAREVDAAALSTTRLDDPLVLVPVPPTLTGVVRLSPFETPLRRATTRAHLIADDADDPIAETTADLDGRFELHAPAPGRYRVELTAPGYDPTTAVVDAAAGEHLDLGALVLQHASTGPDAVWLRGVVRDADDPLTGVAVEVTLAPALPYARVLTARDGRFAVAVAPDEDHHLRIDLDGYALVTAGPYRYDPARDAVVDPSGDPPDLRLTPLP